MQKMLKLNLNEAFKRPAVKLKNYGFIDCLIDTGADIAVWCGKENFFLDIFETAEKLNKKIYLSGFGGKGEFVNIYRIPVFDFSSDTACIHFKNLYIALSNKIQFGFDIILPATMFSKVRYTIDNLSDIPNLQICYTRDEFGFTYKNRKFSSEYINKLKKFYGEQITEDLDIIDDMTCLVQE